MDQSQTPTIKDNNQCESAARIQKMRRNPNVDQYKINGKIYNNLIEIAEAYKVSYNVVYHWARKKVTGDGYMMIKVKHIR